MRSTAAGRARGYGWSAVRSAGGDLIPGTDRLTVEAAQLAKHYGVEIAVCPPRRAQRKGRRRGRDQAHDQVVVADRAGSRRPGKRSERRAGAARHVRLGRALRFASHRISLQIATVRLYEFGPLCGGVMLAVNGPGSSIAAGRRMQTRAAIAVAGP